MLKRIFLKTHLALQKLFWSDEAFLRSAVGLSARTTYKTHIINPGG